MESPVELAVEEKSHLLKVGVLTSIYFVMPFCLYMLGNSIGAFFRCWLV